MLLRKRTYTNEYTTRRFFTFSCFFLRPGYTRSIPSESQYLTSTAVIVGEMMKVFVSIILILKVGRLSSHNGFSSPFLAILWTHERIPGHEVYKWLRSRAFVLLHSVLCWLFLERRAPFVHLCQPRGAPQNRRAGIPVFGSKQFAVHCCLKHERCHLPSHVSVISYEVGNR